MMLYMRTWRRARVDWFVGFFLLVLPVFLLLVPHVPSGRAGGYRAMTTGFPALDLAVMACVAGGFLGWLGVSIGRGVVRRRFGLSD